MLYCASHTLELIKLLLIGEGHGCQALSCDLAPLKLMFDIILLLKSIIKI